MTVYAKHLSTKQTPQTSAIPGTNQKANNAGGFSYVLDDWKQLDRFLILGSEKGSYYAGEQKLTVDNAQAVIRCLKENGAEVVRRIVDVSVGGRAPKNDPAIFALALASSFGDDATKQLAFSAANKVCRTGTHIFQYAASCDQLRGWGRGLRKAVRNWYLHRDTQNLAYQLRKYQQRDGWSHRDLLRLSHPQPPTSAAHSADETESSYEMRQLLHWAVKGWPGVGKEPHPQQALRGIWAFEKAKRATSAAEVTRLIRDFGLVRECVPTQFLNDAGVWEALLEDMPVTAMLRNLGKMTNVGLIKPLSPASQKVASVLTNADVLKKARVHPLNLLVALKTYAQGHGDKGKLTWAPVNTVVDSLDAAFYLAFGAVLPTNKRWLLALDVSGSMSAAIAGLPLDCRTAAAAMALVTANVEPQHHFVAFTAGAGSYGNTQSMHAGYRCGISPLGISPRQRLGDVVRHMAQLPFGGTDCALPMLYATANKLDVDVFVTLTDNETWAGGVHPSQALAEYRQRRGIPAKNIVVGMTATNYSIASPDDALSLDVVGMDLNTPAVMAEFARG